MPSSPQRIPNNKPKLNGDIKTVISLRVPRSLLRAMDVLSEQSQVPRTRYIIHQLRKDPEIHRLEKLQLGAEAKQYKEYLRETKLYQNPELRAAAAKQYERVSARTRNRASS